MANNSLSAVTNVFGSAALQRIISLENPVGSNRRITITRAIVSSISTVSPAVAFLQVLQRSTLPTAGAVITAQALVTSSSAAVGIARTVPTVVPSAGNMWFGLPIQVLAGGAQVNAYSNPVNMLQDQVILVPGEAIVMSANANAVTWLHIAGFQWEEVGL